MTSNLPVDTSSILNTLQSAKKTSTSNETLVPFMKMKGGEWLYGGDDMDVEEGSLWAANPNSFVMGYVAWSKDSTLEGEILRGAGDDPVTMGECRAKDPELNWSYQIGVQLVCTSGEDEGTGVLYKTNSFGGKKALNGLLDEIIAKIQADGTDENIVPLVELKTSSYKHKKHGKTYNPVLEVIKWASLNDGFESSEEVEEDEPEAIEEIAEEPTPPRRQRKRVAK